MADLAMPQYPIYIPSKGRPDRCLTGRIFLKDEVPFRLVIEESDVHDYRQHFGEEHLLVLPFANVGSVIPARNWIREHAENEGFARHWQFDDNIRSFRRYFRGERLPMRSGVAIKAVEDFTDRYTNIAISGFNYQMFVVHPRYPFTLNFHVYSATLINHAMPYLWRGRYNEDTDLCLQALAGGWCTVLINAFMVDKMATMTMGGGNTDALDYFDDGRLRMARSLERLWPGVVTTKRRFKRPQHVVAASWRKFDTPLARRTDIEWPEGVDELGMKLKAIGDVASPRLHRLLDAVNDD